VTLPPLRERPRELPLLVREFAAAALVRLGREPREVSTPAMHALARHRWPGNIRELRNALDYAAAAAIDGEELEVWHLPTSIVDAEPVAVRADRSFDTSAPRTAESFVPIADELRALERKRMLQALRVADGVQTRAAEMSGNVRMPDRWPDLGRSRTGAVCDSAQLALARRLLVRPRRCRSHGRCCLVGS
jgi:two-component system response regulator AtoC